MRLKILLITFLLGFPLFTIAQLKPLSSKAEVSVITCGAGDELYSTFGHSAFRVYDPVNGIDEVYNYGTFNFDTPNFYLKFTQGKLLYSLSKQDMPYFLYAYQVENRWVKEQVLHLDSREKNELYGFLENNHLPENRDYKYDFLYNNCSTKIKDVLEETLGENLHFKENHLETRYTFRELIHQNLPLNSWSSFGIDLALGAVIDKKATSKEHMFLPNYVMYQLSNTSLNSTPLVSKERTILKEKSLPKSSSFLTTPLFWLSAFLAAILILTYTDYKNKKRTRIFDFLLFFISGSAGVLLLFLWFLTDHTATAVNLNVLWLFPFNIIAAFAIIKKHPPIGWLLKYLKILLILLIFTILLGVFKIQNFSPLIIPIIIALTVRYLFLWRHLQNQFSTK
ncbi:DUF4105 domain-containing protein [Arenibacter sp. 6A1]|uniref:lipoprotein N-acyltransferase Lnb domain-containing protein n=1 Tax=Arenibacter sp. 6A1 TaxID=2720391 RepID=UPI001445A6E3|nr:DUF4105 domain-containing protein [Arenibacter sp. 6A1]NKI26314.1 DUF4105 domain-containing protein [Arenibacter sp. 6A1]